MEVVGVGDALLGQVSNEPRDAYSVVVEVVTGTGSGPTVTMQCQDEAS